MGTIGDIMVPLILGPGETSIHPQAEQCRDRGRWRRRGDGDRQESWWRDADSLTDLTACLTVPKMMSRWVEMSRDESRWVEMWCFEMVRIENMLFFCRQLHRCFAPCKFCIVIWVTIKTPAEEFYTNVWLDYVVANLSCILPGRRKKAQGRAQEIYCIFIQLFLRARLSSTASIYTNFLENLSWTSIYHTSWNLIPVRLLFGSETPFWEANCSMWAALAFYPLEV